jgi:hypothetical protein
MIFGFNTDVKSGETVYHVQSEAREREFRLQTQVFVSGRCVAKRATSYEEAHARPDFEPADMHDLLRVQHREVIELVRAGQLDQIAAHAPDASNHPADDAVGASAEAQSASQPLGIEWLNAGEFAVHHDAPLQFLVAESGVGVADARITVRVNGSAGPAQYAQGVTSGDGRALVPILFDLAAHGDVVALLVQASAEGRSVTRKFHLRRTA